MLRRMRDQDNANSQFYLHRVSLDLTPQDINVGFRDENHEDANQLLHNELGSLRAVRYLNVREAPGSISVAINPTAISPPSKPSRYPRPHLRQSHLLMSSRR